MSVSPHLTFCTRVEADPRWQDEKLDAAMDREIAILRPIHEWVSRTAKSQQTVRRKLRIKNLLFGHNTAPDVDASGG